MQISKKVVFFLKTNRHGSAPAQKYEGGFMSLLNVECLPSGFINYELVSDENGLLLSRKKV